MTRHAADPDGPAAIPPWRPVLAVAGTCAVVGFAVRWWTLGQMEATNPLFGAPMLDEALYLERAGEGPGGDLPWFLSPFYPALLWLLGITTRHGAGLLGAALGSSTAAALAVGGAHLGRSLTAGAVAGGIGALFGGFVFLDVTVQTESLLTLLTVACALALARTAAQPSARMFFAVGAVVGLAALARANSLALLVGLVPILLLARRGPEVRTSARWVVLGLLVTLVPVGLVQRHLHDTFSPFPWGGSFNLWLANNDWARRTRSYGSDRFPMDPGAQRTEAYIDGNGRTGDRTDPSKVASYWRGQAWDEMSAAPPAAVGFALVKAGLLFTTDEIGGNHDPIAERSFATWTRVSPVRVWWLLALGAAGWWLCRRRVRGADAIALAAAATSLSLVVVFPLSRYRLPLVPLFVLLGAGGLGAWIHRRPSRRDLIVAACLAGAVSVVAFLPLRTTARPEAWTNLGEASLDMDPVRAGQWYLRAVEDDPSFGPPRDRLGHMALDARDNEGALEHFAVALLSPVTRPSALIGKARALSNLGRHDEALAVNDVLVEESDEDVEAVAEGALLAAVAGRREEAQRRAAHARELLDNMGAEGPTGAAEALLVRVLRRLQR